MNRESIRPIKEVLEKYFERLRIAGLRAAYRLVVERGQAEELPNRPSGLSVLVSSTTVSTKCDTYLEISQKGKRSHASLAIPYFLRNPEFGVPVIWKFGSLGYRYGRSAMLLARPTHETGNSSVG